MAELGYTQEELEQAQDFLRERLRNERSMTAAVERLLLLYAEYLLSALYSGVGGDEIGLLLDELVAQLLADADLLAVDEHDRGDVLLGYVHGERHGDTLDGRVRKRVDTFFDEVVALYAAGRILGRPLGELLPSVKEYLLRPYDNPFIVDARKMQELGEASQSHDLREPHFGKGVPVSSFSALERMLRYAVADAWMHWGWLDASARGAKGYYVVRGSSYPCEECDSHTGVFYRIDDEDGKPQYHLNCCCVVVYSYVDRL